MPAATARQGHHYHLDNINLYVVPRPHSVYNQFDEQGLLIGLPRLSEEKNVDYKKRLLDTYTHRANSTYTGLINGITRELGLSLYKPLKIQLVLSGPTPLGTDPVVIFKGPFIELWEDYAGDLLELEINRYDVNGIAYTIDELVDYINANSTFFIASTTDAIYEQDRSMTILNQSNTRNIFSEGIPISNSFTLTYPGTIGGLIRSSTLFFNDTEVFRSLVSTRAAVTAPGEYFVDFVTGDVLTFTTPSPGTIARYTVILDRFLMTASPVIIHSLQDPNYQRILFEQILLTDGTYANGAPTALGADIINELMSVFPLYEAE